MLLEMLSIPHEWHPIEFSDVKSDEYLKINPNGRLPAIEDPNTGITLWEVCRKSSGLCSCLAHIGRSRGRYSCTSLTRTTKTIRSHMLPDPRNTLPSNGWLSRSLVSHQVESNLIQPR